MFFILKNELHLFKNIFFIKKRKMNKNLLKNIFFIAIMIISASCSKTTPTETVTQKIEAPVDFLNGQTYSEIWEAFKFGLLEDRENFDWLKFCEQDDLAKAFTESSYENLDDAEYEGKAVKALHLVIASSDAMMGETYYFAETATGLELVGSKGFEAK
jgi:hypothetical protein